MKKFLALALALVMICALSVTCFAEETVRIDNDEVTEAEATVKATYVPKEFSVDVYGVDVTFGSMQFTYTDTDQGTWDPDTHSYTDSAEAAWSCAPGAGDVTVTNHSNVDITVTVEYDGAAGGKFNGNATATFDLDTAVGKAVGAADKETVALTLTEAINATNNSLGTVTVTVAKKADLS